MLNSKLISLASRRLCENVLKQNLNHLYPPVFQCSPILNYHQKPNSKPSIENSLGYHESSTSINKQLDKNNNTTDNEFLVRLKSDPDTFGNPPEKDILDEGDIAEEKYFTEQPTHSQKLSTKQYADIIKDLIKKRKIKEAIDLVEIRMLKEDRVKPENYIYNLLLGACGRVGYTKKAFMLFNDMKRRGLKVTGGTYTALFNACANSPWPADGLQRAKHLREMMLTKGYEPNDTNYNAMIKAFGRCGDLPTAFSLVDEMSSKSLAIDDGTINFLLQACIGDKEAGFRHALLVWRKLVDMHIKPSIYTYNLVLRTIRDCGLGDNEVTQDVIHKLVGRSCPSLPDDLQNMKLLESGETDPPNEEINNIQISDSAPTNPDASIDIMSRPNLMAPVPHLGNIVSLSEVTKPVDRLLLVGGCNGFLENMDQNGCKPDIKTFTQLLDCIPSTLAAESDLMNAMKKMKVKPDVDFYNMLIKKRSMRFDYDNAKLVLNLLTENGYRPDLITYGVLALGCKTKEECLELVEEMKEHSYGLNPEILGAMLKQACFHGNFSYVLHIMKLCISENVQPNKKFMEILTDFKRRSKYMSNEKKFSKSQEKSYGIFKYQYKSWIEKVEIDDSTDIHPWQQFRQTTDGEYKYKPKDTARFKARHTSVFKFKPFSSRSRSR
ncbi:unnamed protein product [Phaedon cochleariae]|uniref:Pentatricopeptide repeat-containing protein n=1 Tax=Phaedon cochleariae TaxID=80249 RepID=A0A9N9SG86_PHACE|nr:unnamed protein product [Phaedon cochleariae]